MIRLIKGAIPTRLQNHATAWTLELLAAIAAGKQTKELKKSKYNHPEIKAALKQETHQKCAYCESNPMHVTFGDIEHIVPKSIQPQLAYDWNNLTLACDVCNTKKGDNEGFFDPYFTDPADHFVFNGPMIRAKADRDDAKNTCIGLELNRAPLIEKRLEKLLDLQRRFFEIGATRNQILRRTLLTALEGYANDPATEYKACLATFFADLKAESQAA